MAVQVPVVIVPIDTRLDKVVTVLEIIVPDVGKVMFVAPVTVNVVANAPEVVRLPPSVIVLPVFATPVPPYCPATSVPCHTPVLIVPMLESEDSVETVLETSVPDVGSVIAVAPVIVKARPPAPETVKGLPRLTACPPIDPTVVARDPVIVVTSPVNAGNADAGNVPVILAPGMFVRAAADSDEKYVLVSVSCGVAAPDAVSRPFASTVNVGMDVADPRLAPDVTVANVVTVDPAEVVMSPESAGKLVAGNVPVTSVARSTVAHVATPAALRLRGN